MTNPQTIANMPAQDFFKSAIPSHVKIHIVTGILDDFFLRKYAIDNAEAVLPLFETKFADDRARRCIKAAFEYNAGRFKHRQIMLARDSCRRAVRMATDKQKRNAAWFYAKESAFHCCNSSAKTAALFASATACEALYRAVASAGKKHASRPNVLAVIQGFQLEILKGYMGVEL